MYLRPVSPVLPHPVSQQSGHPRFGNKILAAFNALPEQTKKQAEQGLPVSLPISVGGQTYNAQVSNGAISVWVEGQELPQTAIDGIRGEGYQCQVADKNTQKYLFQQSLG